jgi:hypothetical protein
VKKKQIDTVPMFGYNITIDSKCRESTSSGGRYGKWSSSYDQIINRAVTKSSNVDHPDVVSSLDIPRGSNALVVWTIYSIGDSFGRASMGRTEILGIFLDVKSANELMHYVVDNKKSDSIKLTTSDGQVFKIDYVPWHGYFESLDSVEIDAVTVF